MIDTHNGEFIFDKFILHPHYALDTFLNLMQQENVLSMEMCNTPTLGNVTDIYLKPQKSKDKYFVIRLFFLQNSDFIVLLFLLDTTNQFLLGMIGVWSSKCKSNV